MSIGTIFFKDDMKYKVEINQKGSMYEAIILVWVWTSTLKGAEQYKWVPLNRLMTYQNNIQLVKQTLLDSLPEGA